MSLRLFLRHKSIACLAVVAGSILSGPVFAQSPATTHAKPDINSPAVPIVQTPQPQTAQSTTPQPAPAALTPGETYKQAMRPLDVVRGEIGNWSDSELQALAVGVKMAREACDNAKPDDYKGDDLYDLARLCALGQDWNQANTVSQDYIAALDNTHRAQAFAISVSAMVHIHDIDTAIATARTMLRSLTYDAEVAYSIRSLKDYLEQSGNPAALMLAQLEHPAIVDALNLGTPLKAEHSEAVMGVGALFESGMELALFERYAGDDKSSGATVSDLEDAIGTKAQIGGAQISGADWLEISRVRAQYNLIGWRLPQIDIQHSLETKAAKVPQPPGASHAQRTPALKQTSGSVPTINGPDFGEATVLVLFPEWCAQCRAMMKTVTEFATLNAETPIHAWGLMYADASQSADDSAAVTSAKELEGTNTLVVSAVTAARFAPNDFPTAIVVDRSGVVRFIGPIPADSFNGNGYIERIIIRMATAEDAQKLSKKGN
jgi:thiol-disulfide isomerase/thioredoxin